MPLRFEAHTYPGSGTFEKKFDIPVAMPGSAGVRELSAWADESFMVPASFSRLPDLVSETSGSWIKVFYRDKLIDEFDAARVSLTAGRPNTRTVSGPQRNGLVEGVGILPKDYPNHKEGAFDWKWGAENIFPDLSLADLGSTREEWELVLLGERYQLDLSNATAGTFTLNPDGIGNTAAIDFDASASQVKSALEALAGITDVSVVEIEDIYTIVFETPKDLTTDMTLDDTGITGSATLTKFNDGFNTGTATFTVTVDGQTTEALDWDVTANGLEGTATNNTGLQGLSTVGDVTVSGSGTYADPWRIVFYDPPDPDTFDVTFSAGTHSASQETAGALDPSPITKSKPVDAGAGSEEEHGSYGTPALRVVTDTPLDTGAEWTLFVDATARYAGSQIVINVTPGQTYSNITVPVYPTADADFTLVLRETNGSPIKDTTPRDVSLTSGSYQDLTIDSVTIPDGVDQIIVRCAITDADPAKIAGFYTSWETATFLEGEPEATWTQIIRELLEEAQGRGAGSFLELDATDAADTLGTALSTMSYTQFVGDNSHLGQTLSTGREKGFHWQISPAADAQVITPAAGTTHVIQVYKVDADEIEDLTAASGGPSVTVGGVGVSEAQVVSRRIPYTTLIGLGTGNVSKEDSNSAAETALGRIERVRDVEHLGNETAVQDYLTAQFAEQALNLKAATATVLETASHIPGVDYGPGSKIWWQFPGILDKEARPVKRFSWTHGLTASFRLEGSRILTGEAAVVSAVDMLLRKQGRRRGSKRAPSPSSLISGSGGVTGAYLNLARSSTQTISDGGEAITWTLGPRPFARFADPSFPLSDITIQQPGYYTLVISWKWDTFHGGGRCWITRERGGVESTYWPFDADPDVWESTYGQIFEEGVAPAIPCETGDILRVYVDGQSGSAQDLASATCAVYWVDRIVQPAGTYRETVLADGPVAYWRLDEAEGNSTATDETGNGHDGTYGSGIDQGVAGLLANDPNRAAEFHAASNNVVLVPIHADLKYLDADYTLELWTKVPGTDGVERWLIGWSGWSISVKDSGGGPDDLRFTAYRDGAVVAGSTAKFTRSAVHHLVYTYDASADELKFYVNGNLEDTGSSSSTLTDTSDDIEIGASSTPSDAVTDEVAIYDKVLTLSEIQNHYNVGSG